MVRLGMMKKERELNMIEMKLSEMDEWMIGLDVKESGVYGIKLDDDCRVIESVKVDEVKEWVKKYSDDVLGFEFWVGDEYEYWNIGVEK